MEQLYSLKSAAKKLDTSVKNVRELMKRKGVRFRKKVGSRNRLFESDLEKLTDDIQITLPDM